MKSWDQGSRIGDWGRESIAHRLLKVVCVFYTRRESAFQVNTDEVMEFRICGIVARSVL
jgi:hypothetical protein